jgi:hypothetical protein
MSICTARRLQAVMVSDEIEDMLTAVKAQTNEMFVHYAAADKTAFDDMEQDTMNLTEWHQIVRECSACKFPPEQPKARKIIRPKPKMATPKFIEQNLSNFEFMKG